MTCRELVDFLVDYLDGRLSADERTRFDEHLGDCPECVRYVKQYEETIRVSKAAAATDDALGDDVPEQLVQAILAARAKG
ncbi:MAG: zf-HC2 domain-containing protein [Deltaproteobacteria bacterium]|nr:zf-HC2 domain-containing protein [Deltaproteobacteria bacterium]